MLFGSSKKNEKPKKRFNVKYKENFQFGEIVIVIVVDAETGVNYISTVGNGTSSFTPLLDANGNVVIDRVE